MHNSTKEDGNPSGLLIIITTLYVPNVHLSISNYLVLLFKFSHISSLFLSFKASCAFLFYKEKGENY